MSRVTIFRIEHALTGHGPFGSELAGIVEKHCLRVLGKRMGAHRDIPGYRPGHHVSAVESLEYLALWFEPFREQLLAAGYVLMEYQPLRSNVLASKSGKQVAFLKYAATPSRQLDWEAFSPRQLALAL